MSEIINNTEQPEKIEEKLGMNNFWTLLPGGPRVKMEIFVNNPGAQKIINKIAELLKTEFKNIDPEEIFRVRKETLEDMEKISSNLPFSERKKKFQELEQRQKAVMEKLRPLYERMREFGFTHHDLAA